MTLPDSEIVISRVDTSSGPLVLTSHRVLYGRPTEFTSIPLEDVGSVIIAHLAQRWILFVGGTCAGMAVCLAMAMGYGGIGPVGPARELASALLFVGAFLVVAFGVKRFSRVQISSPNGSIAFRIRSALRKDVKRFLADLDRARTVWYFADRPAR